MIVYFANRKMEIIGTASTNLPEGYQITDDVKTEETDTGVATFECTIGYTLETKSDIETMTKEGNYILRSSGNENEFYEILDKDSDTQKMNIIVYAEDAGLDLLNDVAEAYEATEAHAIAWYFNRWISGSGFEIGLNEISTLTRTLKWDSATTVTERLASIATQFDNAEISFSFEVKGLTITKRLVNIHKKRGKDVQDQLRLNQDVTRIVTKTSIKNLATAYDVTGGTPEGSSNPITLKGYSYDDGDFYVTTAGRLCSREAVKKWGRYPNFDTHIVKQYNYDTTTQSTLCAHAITELKKVCDTELNFEIDIARLPKGIKIGDRINIVDERGELFLSSRILKLETYVVDDKQTATLGEYTLKSSGISAQVQSYAAQFAQIAKTAQNAQSVAVVANEAATAAQSTADDVSETVNKAAIDVSTTGTLPVENVTVDSSAWSGRDYTTYEFGYDSAWSIAGTPVNLADYGITLSATPTSGDTITITYGDSGLIESLSDLQVQLYGDADSTGDIHALVTGVNNVNSNVSALQDKTETLETAQESTAAQAADTAKSMETYKGYINVDESIPAITLGKNMDTKLVLGAQKLAFVTNGTEAASLANDQLDAPTAKVTNLLMQTTDASSGASVGDLAWIARANGHLSLKKVR